MEKICLDCGATLKGRSDKKFCDDQCRSTFNNRQRAGGELVRRQVNAVLRKNHNILQKLNVRNTMSLSREDLLRLGFDFRFHTAAANNGSRSIYCYEFEIRPLGNEVQLAIQPLPVLV